MSSTTRERLRAWLILGRIPGVGPRVAGRLVEHFGDPIRVLATGRAELEAIGLKPALVDAVLDPPEAAADADLAWAEGEGVQILTRDDPRYPPLLAEVSTPPILLFVRGDPEVLKDPMLAIVGSRNPTPTGRETTSDFARYLAACGLTIVSGLAIGIDGAAHAGALEGGRTVAVLGTGPDRVYPAAHRDLARRIAEKGALVTEYPPGTAPVGRNFPRRNRMISGLSLGTLVTEAALKSGSLITARYAVEQGREVFAIPGSIHNPLARGCHALIRDGAKLVESAADILEELAPLLGPLTAETTEPDGSGSGDPGDLDADYLRLLENLGHDPVSPDDLIRRTGLPAQDIASMLLLLELKGYVSSCPGGRYCRSTMTNS
ncbi:DNA-processing protein DprA [Candidatus Thiosymbion oneisti]|uniref:DNA-processing protein DprA n=1 Tax=Candidatus Thiosymbion oneisti TaxID=589554 RepID=UPI000AFD9D6C|nr:DNA-processing protein DprA [Candidatus Thiosymbion oneisti]